MATITNTSTIADLLQLDELSVEEQAAFLDQVGSLIMESSTLRFLVAAEPEVQAQFTDFMAQYGDEENFLQSLLQEFPGFSTIMVEEIKHLETEMRQVLG